MTLSRLDTISTVTLNNHECIIKMTNGSKKTTNIENPETYRVLKSAAELFSHISRKERESSLTVLKQLFSDRSVSLDMISDYDSFHYANLTHHFVFLVDGRNTCSTLNNPAFDVIKKIAKSNFQNFTAKQRNIARELLIYDIA